jgi:REP element-mobilizing transposase RayT
MSRYRIYDDSYPYFITIGVNFGLPIFSNRSAAEIILENLDFMQKKRSVDVLAYVIMENHLHAVLFGQDLGDHIAQFKSYSARKIIDLFKENRHTKWLERLKKVKSNNKSDSTYQLWKIGYHPKQVIGDEMMTQKVEYIHANPVKRGYVNQPEHWRYSSARNYVGMEGLIGVTRFYEM